MLNKITNSLRGSFTATLTTKVFLVTWVGQTPWSRALWDAKPGCFFESKCCALWSPVHASRVLGRCHLTQLHSPLCAVGQIIRTQKPSTETWWSVAKVRRVTELSSSSGLLITTRKIPGLKRFLCEHLFGWLVGFDCKKNSSGYKSTVKVFHYGHLVSVPSVVYNLGLRLVSENYTYFDVWDDANKVL